MSSIQSTLKLNNLPQLKLSATAKTTILTNQIIEFVVNEIKLIPHYDQMSTDLHLMHHIANVIENLERKDLEPKLDKKQLFLDIIKQLFPELSTEQLSFLDNFADFICSNNLYQQSVNLLMWSKTICKKLQNKFKYHSRKSIPYISKPKSKPKPKIISNTSKQIRSSRL